MRCEKDEARPEGTLSAAEPIWYNTDHALYREFRCNA